MVVRSWSELDFDNVCSNAKVFGFDLDNTLASSKQPMKPAMIERFCALLDHTVVALISGGGMAVVTSQAGCTHPECQARQSACHAYLRLPVLPVGWHAMGLGVCA
mgnify:CR=1 FL=1